MIHLCCLDSRTIIDPILSSFDYLEETYYASFEGQFFLLAIKDFDGLNLQDVQDLPNGLGRKGRTTDGHWISIRKSSVEDGRPTVQWNSGTKSERKLRYNP